MPKFFGITNELTPIEKEHHEQWEKLKFWYDDRPELWA